MDAIIRTEGLSFQYSNRTVALEDVSIDIPRGKKVVLLGPNGAGKSTLFLHFNGVLRPGKGKVFFDGKEIGYSKHELEALRSKVAIVLQNPDDQIFSSTVEEDVAFGPMNLGLPHDEVVKRVDEALDQVAMADLRDKPTQRLSFGQRKRVALAGAIAMRPEVLVMDEPTAGLDSRMIHELMELVDELNHKGLTVVMSTHDVETAYSWADEVRVMNRSRLIYSGPSEGFFADGQRVRNIGLTEPILFDMNRSLCKNMKKTAAPYPKNVFELNQKFSFNAPLLGSLFFSPLQDLSIENIKELRHRMPAASIGLIGTKARKEGCLIDLKVEHRFDAYDEALIEVGHGRDFIFIGDETWRTEVERRLSVLNQTYGTKLLLQGI